MVPLANMDCSFPGVMEHVTLTMSKYPVLGALYTELTHLHLPKARQ